MFFHLKNDRVGVSCLKSEIFLFRKMNIEATVILKIMFWPFVDSSFFELSKNLKKFDF